MGFGGQFNFNGPKQILGQGPNAEKIISEGAGTPLFKESREQQGLHSTCLDDIKALAENFLAALKSWENKAKATTTERDDGPNKDDCQNEQDQSPINSQEKSEKDETNFISTQPAERGKELQLQQVLQPDPVNIQTPDDSETMETEAPNWLNSHILELSNTYGVAFEGFERETLELLMRINERKSEMDNRKQKNTTTPKSRGIGKNELKNLQSSLNKEVEGARNTGKNLYLTFK